MAEAGSVHWGGVLHGGAGSALARTEFCQLGAESAKWRRALGEGLHELEAAGLCAREGRNCGRSGTGPGRGRAQSGQGSELVQEILSACKAESGIIGCEVVIGRILNQ